MPLSPGAEVDRYTVEHLLGEGGMARVYRVAHRTLGTHHALKVLNHTGETVRQRLLQEGRVQATLRHPNVVAVTDVLDVNGQPALLMEFVDGPTLEQWLWDLGQAPPLDEALRIFDAILSAVEAAHATGLVHRDLKPANVLMDGSTPKVTDFGLAMATGAGTRHTRTGSTMGTPAYMAPEQIRDTKSVDARADLFALGAILYELVSGVRAFQGQDVLELMNAVAKGEYRPLQTRLPSVPPRIVEAVDGCLIVDPDKRIPDCAALRAVLAGDKVFRRIHTRPPEWRAGRKETIVPAAPSSIHTIDLAGHETIEGPPAEPIQAAASARPRRRGLEKLAAGVLLGALASGIAFALIYEPGETELIEVPVERIVEVPIELVEVPAEVAEEAPVEAPARVIRRAAPVEEPSEEPDEALVEALVEVPVEDPVDEPVVEPAEEPVEAPVVSAVEVVEVPIEKPSTARIRFAGADRVVLIREPSGERLALRAGGAREVPAGHYRMEARFGEQAIPVGRITVMAGVDIRLSCDADFLTCEPG